MIKYYTLLLMIFSSFTLKAQTNDTIKGIEADTLIFHSVEHPPEFPGGYDKFKLYILKNLRHPKYDDSEGRVLVSFIVEKNGKLSHVKIMRGISPGMNKEALRLIQESPKWKPGKQANRIVRVAYTVPISFTLTKQD